LGSSAAATVAGLAAGRVLGDRSDLDDDDLLVIATGMEGHPENAAASLFGGFVVAVMAEGVPRVARFEPPDGLVAVLYIPDRSLATESMRAVLPASVPRADAVQNVGRASLGVAAFASGRLDLLPAATVDRLHEPYRAGVYPELPPLIATALDAGALGACLSGAGSSVIGFSDDEARAMDIGDAMAERASALGLAGRPAIVRPRSAGVVVTSA
jgi:homoserine kinase